MSENVEIKPLQSSNKGYVTEGSEEEKPSIDCIASEKAYPNWAQEVTLIDFHIRVNMQNSVSHFKMLK